VNPDKAQQWEAGFAVNYIHSRVYDTNIPEIIVREDYENEYHRVGAGSQIHIERNSRFAQKSN